MTKVTLWISRKLSTTFKTSRFYFPVYELSRRFCCGFLDFQRPSYYLFICQCVKQQMAKYTSCHEKSLLLVLLWDGHDGHLIFLPFWKFDYETSTPPVIIGLSARWWSRSSLRTVMRPSRCSAREPLLEHNSQKTKHFFAVKIVICLLTTGILFWCWFGVSPHLDSENPCWNRNIVHNRRNTLISVTNFDNTYRREKRVLEAKTSFAYVYIFLGRGEELLDYGCGTLL